MITQLQCDRASVRIQKDGVERLRECEYRLIGGVGFAFEKVSANS